jgi:cardiolipin synthase
MLEEIIEQIPGRLNSFFLDDMNRLGIGCISRGNRVEILSDGDTCFNEYIHAMEGAKRSICLETYIFNNDQVGREIAGVLCRMARKGVDVKVIYDAFGCIRTFPKIFRTMERDGVNLVKFNPIPPWKQSMRMSYRDHRKVLVVDGVTGFTGGINIGDEYAGSAYNGDGWRDTMVMINGPAAVDMEYYFNDTWSGFHEVLHSDIPRVDRGMPGDKEVMVIASHRYDIVHPLEKAFYSAITNAERTIYLTYGYFLPTPKIDDAIFSAVDRGVDIRIIVPGAIDNPFAKYAFQYRYADYLERGIGIYEYRKSILHTKNAVIDGVWSSVGSANIDRRSFYKSLEISAFIFGEDFGREMEEMFFVDLANSKKIEYETWQKRPLYRKAAELFNHRFRDHL